MLPIVIIIGMVVISFLLGIIIWKCFNQEDKFDNQSYKEIMEALAAKKNLEKQMKNKIATLNRKTLKALEEDMGPSFQQFMRR